MPKPQAPIKVNIDVNQEVDSSGASAEQHAGNTEVQEVKSAPFGAEKSTFELAAPAPAAAPSTEMTMQAQPPLGLTPPGGSPAMPMPMAVPVPGFEAPPALPAAVPALPAGVPEVPEVALPAGVPEVPEVNVPAVPDEGDLNGALGSIAA